jgi:hypothetical protein
MAKGVMFLASIHEVPGLNLGKETCLPDLSFSGFLLSLHTYTRAAPLIGHNHCLPHPFQFIIQLSTLMFHHQNAGQNHNIRTANRSFEIVAQFKYLESTVTNQNLIHEEIKRGLNLGSAC